MNIELDWSEVFQAAQAGVMRHISNLRAENKHRHGYDGEGWEIHIQGAIGELAYAKATNRYWRAVVPSADFRKLPGDVGEAQIRATEHPNGCLIVHPHESDSAVFFLVVGTPPNVYMAGGIRGGIAKQKEWWRDPTGKGRPAFFVPQDALTPFKEFL